MPARPEGEKNNASKKKMAASAIRRNAAVAICARACCGVAWGLAPETARTAAITRKPHNPKPAMPSKENPARSVTVPPEMVPHANTSNSGVANMASEYNPLDPGAFPPARTTKGISRRNATSNAKIAPRMLNLFALIYITWGVNPLSDVP